MEQNGKHCGTCFFWSRVAHMLDLELGRCSLFEREMREQQFCGMWEGRLSNAVDEPPNSQQDLTK
jgi:hypothetical protein